MGLFACSCIRLVPCHEVMYVSARSMPLAGLEQHVTNSEHERVLAQGVLTWVGQAVPGQEPPRFEARLFDKLFMSSCVPDDKNDKGAWLRDLNPRSLSTVEGALATPRLAAAPAGEKYVSPSPQHCHLRLHECCSYFCALPHPSLCHTP